MLRRIITEKDFEERFEEWKQYQLATDPHFAQVVEFLSMRMDKISKEAVLLSMSQTSKIELRK